MSWNRVGALYGPAKIHFATSSSAMQLAIDLKDRFYGEFPVESINNVLYWELGYIGPKIMHQPTVVVRTMNNPIELDCRQVDPIIEVLRVPSSRKFYDGTKYIKLYNSNTCLVLTEDEREDLLYELEDIVHEANTAYDAFIVAFEERLKYSKYEKR